MLHRPRLFTQREVTKAVKAVIAAGRVEADVVRIGFVGGRLSRASESRSFLRGASVHVVAYSGLGVPA
jgi:hypothetical protein